MKQERLRIVPVRQRTAKEYVRNMHRHLPPPAGSVFNLGVVDSSDTLRGVAMVGRPVARGFDDGFTLEVNRVATDGCANACSKLYGAAWRAAQALGYTRLITYTRTDEPGTSLDAAGWKIIGTVNGRPWSCPSRARDDAGQLPIDKIRWEAR
jgi:hypothetical protein